MQPPWCVHARMHHAVTRPGSCCGSSWLQARAGLPRHTRARQQRHVRLARADGQFFPWGPKWSVGELNNPGRDRPFPVQQTGPGWLWAGMDKYRVPVSGILRWGFDSDFEHEFKVYFRLFPFGNAVRRPFVGWPILANALPTVRCGAQIGCHFSSLEWFATSTRTVFFYLFPSYTRTDHARSPLGLTRGLWTSNTFVYLIPSFFL